MKGPRRLNFILNLLFGTFILLFFGSTGLYVYGLGTIINNVKLEKQKIEFTENKISDLHTLAADLKQLKENADIVSKSLPAEKEVSRLISQMEGLFCSDNPRADACIVQSISFGSTAALPPGVKATALKDPDLSQSYAKGDLAILTFDISLVTNFDNIYRKLKEIENFSRYVQLSGIQMSIQSENALNINLNMFAYYQPEKIPTEEETATTKEGQ